MTDRAQPHANRATAFARVAAVVRQIIGAPDYERYVDHARQCHPEDRVLSRQEFYRASLNDRYSRPGSRCC